MAQSPQRHYVVRSVADMLANTPQDRVYMTAVDGVDGAGKTTFADELASALTANGKAVIRASVDSFHNPSPVRYERGRHSPEGFFQDSYDYESLKRNLLDPLRAGGSRRYRAAVFDTLSDTPIVVPESEAAMGSVLIFDGIFLHRKELRGYWDFSVFLDVAFDVSIPRGAQRGWSFGLPDPAAPENRRYIEGQRIYMRECAPAQHATIVIDNNDLAQPVIVRRRDRG
ncbi:MAG: uridine kinase [Candidatus Eremiobacteraeota bacterium]|nr:uridine kinase [Candidatus Eremiobacteraeota bacterium]MBC5826179.1 uridine kinase [Candidatus Eremiobacteraeota bacterium]